MIFLLAFFRIEAPFRLTRVLTLFILSRRRRLFHDCRFSRQLLTLGVVGVRKAINVVVVDISFDWASVSFRCSHGVVDSSNGFLAEFNEENWRACEATLEKSDDHDSQEDSEDAYLEGTSLLWVLVANVLEDDKEDGEVSLLGLVVLELLNDLSFAFMGWSRVWWSWWHRRIISCDFQINSEGRLLTSIPLVIFAVTVGVWDVSLNVVDGFLYLAFPSLLRCREIFLKLVFVIHMLWI